MTRKRNFVDIRQHISDGLEEIKPKSMNLTTYINWILEQYLEGKK